MEVMRTSSVIAALAGALVLAGCGGGDGGPSLPQQPPSVHVSAWLQAPSGARVGIPSELDASSSYTNSIGGLSYSWTVVQRPSGASATLQGSGSKVTLTPDAAGTWEVEVTASAGGVSDTASRTFTVQENPPPIVVVDKQRFSGFSGTAVRADASESSDPAGQPLSFTWEVTGRPAGAAVIANGNGPVFEFTPQVEGDYTVRLAVSDGVNPPDVSEHISTVYGVVEEFPFTALAADHHHASERLAVVATDPDAVYLIDLVTGSRTRVDLPATPISVAFSPDGDELVVGHDANLTVVDVAGAAVVVTHPVSVRANSVVHGGNGYVYALPPGQWETIRGVRIADGDEHQHSGFFVYGNTVMRVHPSQPWIYGANRGLSPSNIEKYDISSEPVTYLYRSPYHGTYAMCGNLWFTRDGNRIVTACGNTFRSSAVKEQDMTYTGRLGMEDHRTLTWSAHSPALEEIAVIANPMTWWDGPRYFELKRFDSGYLNPLTSASIPNWFKDGHEHVVTPELVAYATAGGTVYVLANLQSSNVEGHSLLFMRRP